MSMCWSQMICVSSNTHHESGEVQTGRCDAFLAFLRLVSFYLKLPCATTHKHPYFERSAVYISRLLTVSAHGRWSMCQRWCVNHGSSTGRWPQNVVIMSFKNNGPCLSWPWPMSCSHQLEDENRFLKVMRCLFWVLLVSCGICRHWRRMTLCFLCWENKRRDFRNVKPRCMRTLLRIAHLQVSGAWFFLLVELSFPQKYAWNFAQTHTLARTWRTPPSQDFVFFLWLRRMPVAGWGIHWHPGASACRGDCQGCLLHLQW